jgi:type IX secretion system PorP/SprF family membrane protein
VNRIQTFRIVFFLIFFSFLQNTSAQDAQYSQYYAAPLYLNPAFTGSEMATRIGVNYRNQWPGMNAQFTTFSAYIDTYLPEYKTGIGFLAMNDKEGAANLQSTTLAALFSYEIRFGERAFFRPALQASYIRRDIGQFESLVFSNQFNPFDPFGDRLPMNPMIPGFGEPVNLLSLSSGGLYYSTNFWMGFSVHHMNEPNQSFVGEFSRLPRKFSLHTGYKIPLGYGGYRRDLTHAYKERFLVPTLNYKRQGPFEQLEIGSYMFMEPIVVGLWYRGLPLKPVNQQSNRDAIVLMMGVQLISGLNIGYSFDYTVSKIGIQSGGAHELSLSFILPSRNPGSPNIRETLLPCPRF